MKGSSYCNGSEIKYNKTILQISSVLDFSDFDGYMYPLIFPIWKNRSYDILCAFNTPHSQLQPNDRIFLGWALIYLGASWKSQYIRERKFPGNWA